MTRRFTLLLVIVYNCLTATAQQPAAPVSAYDPRAVFPALPILPTGNTYRSASGIPGPDYWQNRADYTIDVTLDDGKHMLTGSMVITYTNYSNEELTYLWLQLDQNAYAKHSRAIDTKMLKDSNDARGNTAFTGGYSIQSVETKTATGGNGIPAKYTINDTRMQVMLPEALKKGKTIQLSIGYSYTIPRFFHNDDFDVNRTDILPTKNGDIYSIAQWYPRLCVLDDVEGWNTLPFLGNGEFYLEYGDFNVNITVPAAYIVEASGELLNPGEVLTPSALERWKAAHNSETKLFIRTAEEVTNPASRPQQKTCTWKYAIKNSRDFAWTASKSFIWEGIRINLPGGKTAFGVSVYPIESKHPSSWERSTEYVKYSIEYFSKKWMAYPYPTAVNVASNLDGMEFPGIVFCSAKDTGNAFWKVVNHELGHTWFPMIVGNNERKYAWMDEGFNVLMDNLSSEDFDQGKFKGYAEDNLEPEQYFADAMPAVMTRPDGIRGNTVFESQYLKVNYLLRLLRDQIIGPDRFDAAFRKYMHDWAYKHPTPWDFFRSMNNSTGEDLGWFWKAMFIENYKLDQSATSVVQTTNTGTNDTEITIDNLGQAAMPLDIEITTVSGKKQRYTFPVEIWQTGYRYTFSANTTEKIQSVEIDPDRVYPDINRSNNVWKQ